jgi:tetratricopeptide (TPR) repeat protein
MAIRGSLKEASFPDVLQLLALGQKSGCLSIVDGTKFGSVFFQGGKISFGAIVNRRDRLGDSLVKRGHITKEQLDDALRQQVKQPGRRVGELIVESGFCSREVVDKELRVLVEEAVFSLFTWTQGIWTFEPDVHPDGRQLTTSINPESLLMEGARRVDEWSLVERRFPSFDLVFEMDAARAGLSDPLSGELAEVSHLLDGRRTIRAVIERSGLGEFAVGKAMYALAMQGLLVQVTNADAARAEDHDYGASTAEKALKLGLALAKAGMIEDSAREFRRVVEASPNDPIARHQLGLLALKQGAWDDAIGWLEPLAQLDDATATMLHHLALAFEGLGRELEAARMLERAAKLAPQAPPQVELSRALHAFRLGDYARAEQLLATSRTRFEGDAPPAVWFHYASLVAAARDDADQAQSLLEEGIRTHPSVGVLHANYAALMLTRGALTAAAAAVERGMLHAANLAPFQKTVGDLAYRVARFDDAMEAYQRAVRLEPSLGPDIYLRLGELRYQRGEVAESERCWHRVLELDPGNRQAQVSLDAIRRAS